MDSVSGATWAAVAMSAITMIGGSVAVVVGAISSRKKAEAERQAVRDKLEFDAELRDLKAHRESCSERAEKLEAAVAHCQEKHESSEHERAELRGRLSVMESIVAKALTPREPH